MTNALGKNTMVGLSLGTIITIIVFVWVGLGIGRPLFASDLAQIEESIARLDVKTSVAVLNLAKQNLQTELRGVKRELRQDPDDDDVAEDIDIIEDDIKDIDKKIECYRTEGCTVTDSI